MQKKYPRKSKNARHWHMLERYIAPSEKNMGADSKLDMSQLYAIVKSNCNYSERMEVRKSFTQPGT